MDSSQAAASADRGAPPAFLYLASIDFPHRKARAIQIVNTCHALARAGCRVTLVVGRREPGPPARHLARYGLAPHPNLRIVGLPVFRLPPRVPRPLGALYTRLWNWTYLAGCFAQLPKLLAESEQVLLARDYRMAWLLLKTRRIHGRPLVFEVHNLPSAELLEGPVVGPGTRREAARRRRLEQAVFAGAWRLLPITSCLRERLVGEYGVPAERVFVVPDAGRSPAPAGGPRIPARRRLIYVGQLYPHKGVELAIRALAGVPEAELAIVGGLPDDPQRGRLERLVGELGLGERVRFAGPQPYERVPMLLAEADVALLPLADGPVARCFTSPLKLFDYLAAGLPIVAVDFPTTREVLHDGENALLVRPGDPAALAAAVKRLLGDPKLAAQLGNRARLDAADYTWERRAERILAAVAAGRAGGRERGRGGGSRRATPDRFRVRGS